MRMAGIGGLKNSRGVAMVIVMVIIVILALIGSFAANLGLNQRRIINAASSGRAKAFYYAQAGVVDANWRIRVNLGGAFTNPASTLTYNLDVEPDGVNDVTVTIGAVGAVIPGLRKIDASAIIFN